MKKPVEIPALMKHLPRDHRGLPIPPTIVRAPDGSPLFTINDQRYTHQLLAEDRCPVCGNKFHRARWLVGGPLTAFHPSGAFADPPMHGECMRYALQVCPYLAAPKWTSLEGTGRRKMAQAEFTPGAIVALPDHPTPFPQRPTVFVAVQLIGRCPMHTSEFSGGTLFAPPRPYRQVEYWCQGQRLSTADGEAAVHEALLGYAEKLQQELAPEETRL